MVDSKTARCPGPVAAKQAQMPLGWICWDAHSTGTSTGSCLECFPLVNNLPHSRIMDFRLFGNSRITFVRLMGSNNCSKIIADVFPPWHCVNTHPNAPDQQTNKSSAFIYRDDHTYWWSANQGHLNNSAWLLLITLLIPQVAVLMYLVFHPWLLHFGLAFVK